MKKELPNQLKAFLRSAGFDSAEVEKMSLETRLLQDLHQEGDDFLDTMALLGTTYGVDMNAFDWRNYTASEGELLTPFWFLTLGLRNRRYRKYAPVTLGMIDAALNSGKWTDRE